MHLHGIMLILRRMKSGFTIQSLTAVMVNVIILFMVSRLLRIRINIRAEQLKFTPLALETLKSLKEQNGNSKYVVCNKKGEIVRETYVNREFHKILDAVKIKVDKGGGVNILRNSFGLFLANNNFTPENIACILGFAKESSTEKYFADKKHKEFIEKCAGNEFFN